MADERTRAYRIAYSDRSIEHRRRLLEQLARDSDDEGLREVVSGYMEMLSMEENASREE